MRRNISFDILSRCPTLNHSMADFNGTFNYVSFNRGDSNVRVGPLPVHESSSSSTKKLELIADDPPTLEELEALLAARLKKGVLEFVRTRIRRLWPLWTRAVSSQKEQYPFMKTRRKQTIVV